MSTDKKTATLPEVTATSGDVSTSATRQKTKKTTRNAARQKASASPTTKEVSAQKTIQQSFLQRYFAHLSVALFGFASLIGLQSAGCFQTKPQPTFVPVVSNTQVEEHVKTAILAGLPNNDETRERIKEFLASNVIIEHEAEVLGILADPVMRDRLTTTRFAILAEAVIKADAEKNPVDEKFVRENYDMQKAAYSPREYQLRHIAFKDEDSAKKAYQELVDGADFIATVQAYTIDNDKVQNGWLGWLKANQLGDEAFRQATIHLKKGEFSTPIKTTKAWQIVRLEDIRDLAPFPSFEEQKDRIQAVLSQRKAQLRLTEKVKTVQFK